MVSKVITVPLKVVPKFRPNKNNVSLSVSNIHFDSFLRYLFFLNLQICSYFNIYHVRVFLDNTAKKYKAFQTESKKYFEF